MDPLTVEEFKEALPAKFKKSVNQSLVDEVNATLSEPEMFETYRDNLLSYTTVMQEGKFQISSYLSAVKYVSFKIMGLTNIDSYSRTFPDKIARFAMQNVANKDIASYVTAYNKSKLVNLVYKQSMIPTSVLNQDKFQEAINKLTQLMHTAKSELVQEKAANDLLVALKPPETNKIELDIGLSKDSSINLLKEATLQYIEAQKKDIITGKTTAAKIASEELKTIEGEDITDD